MFRYLSILLILLIAIPCLATTVNVTSAPYNAVGDGVTDDTAHINSAIAALVNGDTLLFPCGTYKTTSQLTINKSVTIDGSSCATIRNATAGSNVLSMSGGGLSSTTTVTSTTADQANSMVANFGTIGAGVGNYVLVSEGGRDSSTGSGDTACDISGCRSDVMKISSLSGTTATFTRPLNHPYTSVNAPTVRKLNSPLTVTVRNITFDGGSVLANGLNLNQVVNSTVTGVTFQHFTTGGFSGSVGFGNTFTSLTATTCGSSSQGCIDVRLQNQTAWTTISITASSGNHFGFSPYSINDSTFSTVTVDLTAATLGRPLKLLANAHNSWTDVTINGQPAGGSNGMSLEYYSHHNVFTNCIVTAGHAIATFGNFNDHNTFTNCTVHAVTGNKAFSQSQSALGNTKDDHTTISGGTWTGVSGQPVMQMNSSYLTMTSATISGPASSGFVLGGFSGEVVTGTCLNSNTFTGSISTDISFTSGGGTANFFNSNTTPHGTFPNPLPTGSCGTSTPVPALPSSGHVYILMLENHSYDCNVRSGFIMPSSQCVFPSGFSGSTVMPYLKSLATTYAYSSEYYANTHYSIPNYFWVTAGDHVSYSDNAGCLKGLDVQCTCTPTTTVTLTPTNYLDYEGTYKPGTYGICGPLHFGNDNIIRRLIAAGKTWRSYQESLPFAGYMGYNVPTGCGPKSAVGGCTYVKRHNPTAYFDDVRNSSAQRANVVPWPHGFDQDVTNGTLPNWAFITPNLDDDAHDASMAASDTWLSNNVPKILATTPFQTGGDGVLIITWDEGSQQGDCRPSATCPSSISGSNGGGKVFTVVIGPNVKHGFHDTTFEQGQNLLKMQCALLGLSTCPGAANSASDMGQYFTVHTGGTSTNTISAVSAGSLTPTGATVQWVTSVASSSQVEYGLSVSYGSSTTLDSTLVTSHSQAITGLASNQTYHYRVKSVDSGVTTTSGDFTFRTKTAQTSGTGVAATFFGMHMFSPTITYPTVSFGTQSLWDAQVSWKDIETSRGVYNWSKLDQWITMTQAHGQEVVYTFGKTPGWAGPSPTLPPTSLTDWDDFVTAIVTHAAGKIKYWEIWNEPNSSTFWTGSNSQLVSLASRAYPIIHGIDASAKVLTPAPQGSSSDTWMDAYLTAGGTPYVDIVSFHGYVSSSNFSSNIVTLLTNMRSTMTAHSIGSKELWDTEGSWGTNVGYPDLTNEASVVGQLYLLHVSRAARFIWYGWDYQDWGTLWDSISGIHTAGIAYSNVRNWLLGATVSACTSSGTVYTCNMTRTVPTGYSARAVWDTSGSSSYSTSFGTYRKLDGTSGTVSGGSVTIGFSPILLEDDSTTSGGGSGSGGANGLVITPTTTVAAETGNNTSAMPNYNITQNNNLAGHFNISKVDVHTLLYSGNTTMMLAWHEPWFCTNSNPSSKCGGHIQTGYVSNNTTTVQHQIDDMISRGYDGLMMDWSGGPVAGTSGTDFTSANYALHDQVAQKIKTYAESVGFKFGLSEDQRAMSACAQNSNSYNCGDCNADGDSACSINDKMVNDINYLNSAYFGSSAYIKTAGGHPIVTFFSIEGLATDNPGNRGAVANMAAVKAHALGSPALIWRQAGAFGHTWSDGGFSWVHNFSGETIQSYLGNFYRLGKASGKTIVGSWSKGFNDTLAGWGQNRIHPQYCGQTYLQYVAVANTNFNASNQIPFMVNVTWNDFDEGSEIETGITNCVSVQASGPAAPDTVLHWGLSAGDPSTIHHWTVYISTNGTNLMVLQNNLAPSVQSLDLSNYSLGDGTYYFYVKAVGQPEMTNVMSGQVKYDCSSGDCVSTNPSSPTPVISSLNPRAVPLGYGNFTLQVFGSGYSPESQVVWNSLPLETTYVSPSEVDVDIDSSLLTVASTDAITVVNPLPGGASNIVNFLVGQPFQGGGGPPILNPPDLTLTVTPDTGVDPLQVIGNITVQAHGTHMQSEVIDWGDGGAISGSSGVHTYTIAGTYTVTATVVDDNNNTLVATHTVTVTDPIVAPGVTFLNVPANAKVASPLRVYGTVGAHSGQITNINILVDGVLYYTTAPNTGGVIVDKYVYLNRGLNHTITIEATDGSGTFSGSVVVFCVDYTK